MKKKLFGQILIDNNRLVKEELDKALKVQSKTSVRIGQILLKKGIISEQDVLFALSIQFELEFIEKIEPKNIEQCKEKTPLKFVQKYKIVPFYEDGSFLKVAIYDPLQIHPLDELKLMWIGYVVEPVLATESEIIRIINHFYENKEANQSEELGLEEGLEFLDNIDDIQDSLDGNEAPIIRMVNVMLSNAVTDGASDIHIEPQEKEIWVRFRIDGILHKILTPPKSIQNGIISRIKIMANMNIAENRLPQDGRIKIRFGGKDIDIRVSSLPTQFGERIVMRLLNKTDTKFTLDSIGFDKHIEDDFRTLLQDNNGIILITGPTGSGKTSTLYAALTEINNEETNIITVEDPIEYQINGISQMQAKPKIGLTFAEGLRTILRQDPDVIMVGEIRDEETARVAIQSSLTGHLVFSTLHTNDSASAVIRLADMGIEPYLITSTCRGFMAQRLVRTLCDNCKKKKMVVASSFNKLGLKQKSASKKKIAIYEPVGCKECKDIGYKGRIGVYELLLFSDSLKELLLTEPSLQVFKEAAVKEGMTTLREAALKKVIQGETSLEEALRVT